MKAYIGRFPRNNSERKISIRVDKWDSWNADSTIAMIAVPILEQLKVTKHGAPFVDDDDVPENIRSCNAKKVEDDHIDEFHFQRWDYVLDEIIWGLKQTYDDSEEHKFFIHEDGDLDNKSFEECINSIKIDQVGLKSYHDRIDNALRLFGKYYRCLWD